MTAPRRLLHLMSSLEVGGRERVVLDLARRARSGQQAYGGLEHELLLFDAPYRPGGVDFDPEDVPWSFLERGPGLDLGFARRLRRFIKGNGFGHLHAHNETAIVYAALANLPVRAARTFGTFHTYPGHDTPRARKLSRWATRRLDGVVAVSAELGERLTADGWSVPPRVIWNGVDAERFRPADGSVGGALPGGDQLHVATLARADPIKRASDLIEAVVLARGAGARIRASIVGNGPIRADLEAQAGEHSFIDVVPRVADVPAFLQTVDVFCLVSDHEAAPRALLEAMASGVACCVTEVGGMPEMLTHHDGGLAGTLVPPRYPGALAAALGELATDAARRGRDGARARERALDFSAEREWSAHVGLWTGTTPGSAAGSAGPS